MSDLAGYGVHFGFEIKSETRDFYRVDTAAEAAGIKPENMPQKPSPSTACSRAVIYLQRSTGNNIDWLPTSKYSTWTDSNGRTQTGRNPNYSLKITVVRAAHIDTTTTWRFNITNRNTAGENMRHVLSLYSDSLLGMWFVKGTDDEAFAEFGADLQDLITAEYNRFLNNYNEDDIRKVLDAELSAIHALKIIKKTSCFIPQPGVETAQKLAVFAKDCGQVVSWLGLDKSELTRDTLLQQLQSSIFDEMDAFGEALDAKLNDGKARSEGRRNQAYNNAMENIDRIMATADYHALVLGVMADGIKEKRDALKARAYEFLVSPAQTAAFAQAKAINPDDAVFE